MRKLTNTLGMLFAAIAAVGLNAGAASAQNLRLDQLAAALALPVITGGQAPNAIKATRGEILIDDNNAVTLATVTNGKTTPVLLKVDVISGDPVNVVQWGVPIGGDTWQSDSFDCLLTGRETTTFVITADGNGSVLFVECSTPFATDGPFADNKIVALKAQNGILWLAAADPATGKAISENVLFADAVVADPFMGGAYSVGAIPFQAGQGFNDGNKIYRFDGDEYARWPSVVATNYIVPDQDEVDAELILFTLDGTTGNPTPPRVAVGGLGYDDDENYFDFQHEFDCFDIVALEDISPNFTEAFNGGSFSGHLQLVAQPVGTANDVHDAAFGDANNVRRRPVHGWIVQRVIPGEGTPALWARPLAQGEGALMPFGNDQNPVLDADPLL